MKYDELDDTSPGNPTGYTIEGDYPSAVTITITEWDEDDEVSALTYTSNVGPVRVEAFGGGSDYSETAESGTITDDDLGGSAISNVEFFCPENNVADANAVSGQGSSGLIGGLTSTASQLSASVMMMLVTFGALSLLSVRRQWD